MSTLIQQSTETLDIGDPEKKVWTDAAFMALPGEDVIPGFTLPVADLFQKLSF